jgi:hypothetical protein
MVGTAVIESHRWVSINSNTSPGSKCLDEHLRRPLRHRSQDTDHATTGVEQRHGRQPHRSVDYAHPIQRMRAVVDQAAMVQHGALRETRRTRGVLDHHSIVRIDHWQIGRRAGSGVQEISPLVESDHLAEIRTVRSDLLDGGEHRIAPERCRDHDARRLRLVEHILDFLLPEAWVDRDQNKPGHCRAELHHDPLRYVRRPDGDALAGFEPAQQCVRSSLRVGIELGIRPPAPGSAIGNPGNQRQAVGSGLGGPSEQAPEGEITYLGLPRAHRVRHRQ